MIDELYLLCAGVTLPDGYFFDPDRTIKGAWGEEVKAELKVSIERCGCDSAPASVKLSAIIILITVITTISHLFWLNDDDMKWYICTYV